MEINCGSLGVTMVKQSLLTCAGGEAALTALLVSALVKTQPLLLTQEYIKLLTIRPKMRGDHRASYPCKAIDAEDGDGHEDDDDKDKDGEGEEDLSHEDGNPDGNKNNDKKGPDQEENDDEDPNDDQEDGDDDNEDEDDDDVEEEEEEGDDEEEEEIAEEEEDEDEDEDEDDEETLQPPEEEEEVKTCKISYGSSLFANAEQQEEIYLR